MLERPDQQLRLQCVRAIGGILPPASKAVAHLTRVLKAADSSQHSSRPPLRAYGA
jgi:hypothetical protein